MIHSEVLRLFLCAQTDERTEQLIGVLHKRECAWNISSRTESNSTKRNDITIPVNFVIRKRNRGVKYRNILQASET